MNRYHWKQLKTFIFFVSLIIAYCLIRIRTYEYAAGVFIPNIHPNEAWEYVADFSNMKFLNPTLADFEIVDESGNYEHWKYSVSYNENLSHWPHFANEAIGHFDVKADKVQDKYYIHSVHRTCLFFGIYCLNSKNEFAFSKSNQTKGTNCHENVKYQCPAMFSSFCRREVAFQRAAIMLNLKKKLTNKY